MRLVAVLLVAWVCLPVVGSLSYLLGIEVGRPDVALIVATYLAARRPGSGSFLVVFLVGVLADLYGGGHLGLSMFAAGVAFLACGVIERRVLFAGFGAWLLLLLGMTVVGSLAVAFAFAATTEVQVRVDVLGRSLPWQLLFNVIGGAPLYALFEAMGVGGPKLEDADEAVLDGIRLRRGA
jgi:rod shape-determining protein MreD